MKLLSKKRQEQVGQERIAIRELMGICKGKCMDCGKRPDWRGLSLHHKVFKSHGGGNTPDNVVLLCGRCHSKAHLIIERG